MNDTVLAASIALLTAAVGGPFSVFVRRGLPYGNAVTGVIIGLTVSLPLLMAALAVLWEPGWWNPKAALLFAALGLMGPSLGRVFMYQSIHYLGVARSMPLIATLPLTTAVAAYGVLGERPGPYIWAGTFLIVAGCIGLTMKGKAEAVWDRRYLWVPLMSVTGFTIGNLIRKVGLEASPSPLFGVTITYCTALVSMLFFQRFLPPERRADLRWGGRWVFYGFCGLINTVTIFLRFMATRYGDLTIVVPIFGTSAVFAVAASWLLLRDVERITWPIAGGAVFIMLGGVLVAWRIL